MKKLIILTVFTVLFISGCADKETSKEINTETSKEFVPMSEEEIKRKSQEYAEIEFKKFREQNFNFNEEDFEYTGSYSFKSNDLGPYIENTYIFKPKTAVKFINIGNEISKEKSHNDKSMKNNFNYKDYAGPLLYRYYLLYIYNDFLVDREQGNRLDEMFIDLENQGIKYYIQKDEPIDRVDFVEYVEFPDGNNSYINRLKPGVEKTNYLDTETSNILEEFRSSDELGIKQNLDVTKSEHMKKFMEMMDYYPIIRIELNSENHTTEDLEKLNEWAKGYYNTDILQIQFTRMYNYKKDCSIETLESIKTCGIIKGQDFNGSFIEDFRTGKIKRKPSNEKSDEFTNYIIDDPNGVIYKWNEVAK